MGPDRKERSLESPWARRLAHRLAGGQRGDDLVQDAWLASHSAKTPTGSVNAWVAAVLRNLARQLRRTESRRAQRERVAARREALPSTGDLVERAELARRIAAAMRALPEPYRSTVLLHHEEGLPSVEIARRLGVPSSTVRNRLRRAHTLLRREIEQRYGGDPRLLSICVLAAPRPGRIPWIAAAAAVIGLSFLASAAAAAEPGSAHERRNSLPQLDIPAPHAMPGIAPDLYVQP